MKKALVKLSQWRIFETNVKTRHLVGFDLFHYEDRISSRIVGFDKAEKIVRTSSRQIYQLLERPAPVDFYKNSIEKWCKKNDLTVVDVTEEYI